MTKAAEQVQAHLNPSISVSQDSNQNVVLGIWTDIVAGEQVKVILSPENAATLLRDLANQATYALTAAAANIAAGDCGTCRNVRMIDVPARADRTERVHCPDCSPNGRRPFPLRPQIGGGLA